MKKFLIELGLYSISWSASAQRLARLRFLRIRITTLNHKSFYHTMKQRTIKKMFSGQFHKVLFVFRCLIVQDGCHVTIACFNSDKIVFVLRATGYNECTDQKDESNPLHSSKIKIPAFANLK